MSQFEVEKILAKMVQDGWEYYQVQWKGESPETATWEPTENLNPSMVEHFNHTLLGKLFYLTL